MAHMAATKVWTSEEVRRRPDDGNRYEIVDGELFVTPAPTFAHQRAVIELARRIADYLAVERVAEILVAPADVDFSERRVLQPDVFVLPLIGGRRADRFSDVGRLLLAVEVSSAATARADRVRKRAVYADEGVEYWIVDLDARTIERSTPGDARVTVVADALTWTPEGATSMLTLDVVEYFRRVLDD
jgi:Uma2 family endonuclease